jgi:hypothetical protein
MEHRAEDDHCPESINGCQYAAWRPMMSRSSSVVSRANVGRGALNLKTKVLMAECMNAGSRSCRSYEPTQQPRDRQPRSQGKQS